MVLTKVAQAAQNLASRMNEGRKNIAHFTVDSRHPTADGDSALQRCRDVESVVDVSTNVAQTTLICHFNRQAAYEKELWANQRRPRRETRKNCGRINYSTASTERVRPALLLAVALLRERK